MIEFIFTICFTYNMMYSCMYRGFVPEINLFVFEDTTVART